MSLELWNQSLSLLAEGDYDNGWPSHEWIRTGNPEFKDTFCSTPDFGKPIWRGEVEPITLLINADFGMGDTIHFWRFVEAAKTRVTKVILRCDEDFKHLFTGVDLITKDESFPEFDKIIHMMALPHALGIKKTDISGKAYLTPTGDPPEATKVLDRMDFTKIGICWGGNPFNPRDSERSIPVEEFQKIPAKLLSLNKLEAPPEGIMDLRGLMRDWNQTAHLLRCMDLVITVDTAVAHLAGALGVTVWTLIGKNPDWRWGSDGEFTPWYNSMRLFRSQGEWSELFEAVVNRKFFKFITR